MVMSEAVATPSRRRLRTQQSEHRGATGAVVVGGIGAALAYLLLHKPAAPTASGCAACGLGLTPPPLADGLYQADAAQGGALWAVKGGQRWGIPSAIQAARCYGTSPVVHPLPVSGFGNADVGGYIGTVGYIAAGCPCIDVPH
jgi:hypothetical protein